MPTWILQELEISGEKKDLTSFVDKFLGSWRNYIKYPTEGQFHLLYTFCPIPNDVYYGSLVLDDIETSALEGTKADDYNDEVPAWTKEQLETAKKKYGTEGIIDGQLYMPWAVRGWILKFWGTECPDVETSICEMDNSHIRIFYKTAWVPISFGLENISKEYPQLTFNLKHMAEFYCAPGGGMTIKGGEFLNYWKDTEKECERNRKEIYGLEKQKPTNL